MKRVTTWTTILLAVAMLGTTCLAGDTKKEEEKRTTDPMTFLDPADQLMRARNDTLAEMYIKEKELESLQKRLDEVMTRIRARQDAERRINADKQTEKKD